mmetsp:Transcript_57497/g.85607  ORF Transcript_57497/g.85607 Transcript_57497/m.85607 type:complete len:356 (-) Transcript_57497:173-1240(-)
MRENQASLTAATVAFVASLKWYTGDQNAMLQAEIMRNISWRHLPLPLWLFARFVLCHEFFSRAVVHLWRSIQGSTNAMEGLWMRKSYMEHQVRSFLVKHRNAAQNKGSNKLQVLIVAAGYDTLTWRLALEYPDVNFIELDHPATGRAKINALRNVCSKRTNEENIKNDTVVVSAHNSAQIPQSLYFCHKAVNEESTSLKQALANDLVNSHSGRNETSALQYNIPTAVVVEGLTFYLTEEENRSLFQQLGDLFGCQGSIVAFNFFNLDSYGRPTNPNTQKKALFSSFVTTFMKYKVKVFGEPFKWGIEPDKLPSFFHETGWRLIPSTLPFATFGDDLDYTVMMGIEYEATVEWIAQ